MSTIPELLIVVPNSEQNMNKNRNSLCLFISLMLFVACAPEIEIEEIVDLDKNLIEALIDASPTGRMDHYILANEYKYKYLPNQDPQNPITYEKAKLGKMLFFETGLGQEPMYRECQETYSCATCHVPSKGFLPGRIQGIADGAAGFGLEGATREILGPYQEQDLDAQGVRPLSVLNVAYVENTLWSGIFGSDGVNIGTEDKWTGPLAYVNALGYTGLESQNIEGLHLHRMKVNEKVLNDYGYRPLFDAAFPEMPVEERYGDVATSFALGAYLRTLLTTQAPFQSWLKGDRDQMTEDQKKGAMLFFGKARCVKCHKGPSLSSVEFHVLGTADLHEVGGLNTSPEDKRNLGRGLFTENESDFFKFKVPQLYNLKDYATFFHGSSKESIEEVVDFKLRALSENPKVPNERLSSLFQPIELSDEERGQLVDFLTHALYDPNIDRFVPDAIPSGHCFPNNDERSKRDLGCN